MSWFTPSQRKAGGAAKPFVRTLTAQRHDLSGKFRDGTESENVETVKFVEADDRPEAVAERSQYGVRFSRNFIERTEDLTGVPFLTCINEKIGLAPHLFVTIAVVQCSAHNKSVVLLLSPTITQDQISGLKEPKIVFRFVIVAILFALLSLSTLKLR